MHVVVVAGSSLATELEAGSLAAADLVVAVDGGAEALARVGVVPDLLVGDMDSVSLRTRAELTSKGVEVLLLPTAKDETDTEAALRLVVERGAEEITVYGALGGPRLDHLIGNLFLLTSGLFERVRVRMVDDLHEAFLVKGNVVVDGSRGDLVSLLPLTPAVEDVRTEGLLYPLAGETLHQSATRGVSNMMTGFESRVTHGSGVLLLIHYRGR
ncbi:MAG: thiamine diphosphokinase [Actinobacteria bacterium]|nr:thiamine diphosphokinase [Actinomycetota bacterium]